MADGGDPNQGSLLLDAVKVLTGGVAGYGLKWLQARAAAENKHIQACLDQLDGLANDGAHSFYAILDGKPDDNVAYRVRVGRGDLGVKLNRAIGQTAGYARVITALAAFARSLALADPHAGKATHAAQHDDIRNSQQLLRRAITSAAQAKLWWRFSKHDTGK